MQQKSKFLIHPALLQRDFSIVSRCAGPVQDHRHRALRLPGLRLRPWDHQHLRSRGRARRHVVLHLPGSEERFSNQRQESAVETELLHVEAQSRCRQ